MSSRSRKTPFVFLLYPILGVFLFVSLTAFPSPVTAAAGVNKQINFQGRLLNSQGATVPDGNYNIEFKVYQDGDGLSANDATGSPAGSLKWTEDYLNSASHAVAIRNGYLSVQLGSINPFGASVDWNQDTIWLSIDIGNTSSCTVTTTFIANCGGDGEMLPMKRLSSTPYALNSGLLGGLASTQFVQLAQGVQTEAGTSTNSIFINKTGTGGNFLDLQAGGTDAFTLNNSGDAVFGNNANHNITVTTAGAGTAGKTLTLTAGAAGTGGSALAGGDLVLQGGTGGGTNGNGGNITVDAGTKNGTGTNGVVNIGTSVASAVNIATNNAAHTISIGNGTAVQGITIGSTNGNSSLLFQAGSGGISLSGATTISGANTFSTGTGTVTIQGVTTVSANFSATNAANIAFQKGTDYSNTVSTNNVNFGTGALIRLTGASTQTITGIANGVDGRILTLVNAAGQTAILSYLSGSSLAINQINTGTGGDLTVPAGASVSLVYDAGASVWRVVGSTSASGGYIQLQGSTPGTQQSGNFNISGTGIVGTLSSAATASLTITGNAASTWSTTAGLLTIQGAGGIAASGAAASSLTTSVGALTLTGAAASIWSTTAGALTLTSAAAATWSTGAGLLTLQGAGGVSVQSAAAATSSNVTIASGNASAGVSGNVSIDNGTFTSGTPTITLGTTSARSVQIGNTTAATTVLVQGGTGATAIAIQAGSGGTISVGAGGVATTVQIGNTTGGVAQTINIGNNGTATSTSTVVIGSATTAGDALILEAGTGATAIQIGNSASAHGIQIGTGAAQQTVVLGSTNGASATAIQAGSGGISLTGATTVTGTNAFTSGTGNVGLQGVTTISANLIVTNAGNVAFQHGSDVSTTTLNDANLGTSSLVRLTGATTQTLTGITGGADGRILTIINAAAQAATISNQNAGSTTASDRIITGTGGDMSLPNDASITLVYDSGAGRWRVIGSSSSTGGYVQLQGSTPGAQQSGHVNISGTIIAGVFDSAATGTLNLGTANASTINIGTNAAAHTINIGTDTTTSQTVNIGSTNGASPIQVLAGSGGIAIQAQGGTVGLGNNSVQQALIVGNSTSGTSVTIFCGTGSCTFGGGGTHTTTIGSTGTTSTTNVQGGTGGINIGTNNVAQLIQVGSTANSVAQTIGIGNNSAAGSSTAITIGSTVAGNITLQSAATINIGQNSLAQTLNIGNTTSGTTIVQRVGTSFSLDGIGTSTYTLGASTTTGSITIGGTGAQTGNIDIGLGTGAQILTFGTGGTGAKTVTVGSVAGASQLTLQAGTSGASLDSGTGNITIGTSANNKTLNIGAVGTTANTTTINIANTTGNATQIVSIGAINSANNAVLIQGGTSATAVNIQSGAAGTIGIGTNNTANTVQIGSGTLSAGTQTIYIGTSSSGNSTGTTNVTVGAASGAAAGLTTVQAKGNVVFSTNGVTRGTLDAANNFYFGNGVTASAPNNFVIQGTGSATTAVTGGAITLQGGNATVGSANGGNLMLAGGAGFGTGVNGLVVLTTPTFQTAGTQACGSNCTITQASIDSNSAVIVNATAAALTITMPSPTTTTAGRIVYVTAANGSNDFTLSVNGGGTGNTIAMRQNTTATMIWNGSAWTAAGASSSTTLQSAYDNTLTSAGGAELILSSTSNHNGLTIRDSATLPVNSTLLEVQTSTAASLFSVNGTVTDYANNGGAESTFGTEWAGIGTGASVSRNTTSTYVANGTGSVKIANTAGTANIGGKNVLTSALNANLAYNVSFAARLDSTSSGSFTDLNVFYSVDGSTASVACSNYSTQTVPTSVWVKVNCTFTAPSSGITASNAIFIRQTASATRIFYVDNFSVTVSANLSYATDGSVDDGVNFGTNWTAVGSATAARSTTVGNDTSDSAQVTTTAANQGIRNKLSISPFTSTLYRITVYAASTTSGFNTFTVNYSRDGGTNFVACADYNTQTISSSTTSFTQITCYITTDGTNPTNPYVYFTQTDATGRIFYVDTFSMNISTNAVPNVQIGGGLYGGPVTLFTLDRAASAPIASNNAALLGSMYYDTTLGKLQCYESDGWGACGSSPDNIITISPEYTNAVMHGTGIGTMTSDICSDALNINDGSSSQPTICGTNETYNFYKWTSPQATAQTYSIYVTYQLPSTFKSFSSGQTSIMARTDSSNATVQYSIYHNITGTGLTQCGSTVSVSTGSVSSWQTGIASGAADPSTCGFSGGDSIVFKIDVIASSSADAYVGNLNFTFSNK